MKVFHFSTSINLKKNYEVLFAHWLIRSNIPQYTANFTLFIYQIFNSVYNNILVFASFREITLYNFCLFVDVPNKVFIYGTSKKIFVVYWAHLVKGISQTFRSKFHIFVGSVGVKSFVQQVLKSFSGRNNFLDPLFLDFLSLPDGLKDSTEFWILVSWVLD